MTAPLRKLPDFTGEGLSGYRHEGGFVIRKQRRNYSLVGQTRGLPASDTEPLYWWHVRRHGSTHGIDFPTLREARVWCDEQVADA